MAANVRDAYEGIHLVIRFSVVRRPGNPAVTTWPSTLQMVEGSSGPAHRWISAVAEPPAAASIEGSGSFPIGATATLRALPERGARFLYWRTEGRELSRPWLGALSHSLTVRRDQHFEAVFEGTGFGRDPSGVSFLSFSGEVGVVSGATGE